MFIHCFLQRKGWCCGRKDNKAKEVVNLACMKTKPIQTEEDYKEALERLEIIFDAQHGTPQGVELETLSLQIEQYEIDKYPLFQQSNSQ